MDKLIIGATDNLPVEVEKDTIPVPVEGKTLYITPENKEFDFNAILDRVVQYVNLAEIWAEIKAGTQYVVQIPPEFQSAYEYGEMFIMQNQKNGKMWPMLMEIAENGHQQVVAPLPITEQAFAQGNPVQKLAGSYHDLLMQKQIENLTAMVENTYRLVERIEHGQMDDRIGRLEAGKNGLLLAMSMPEGDERRLQISSSRQNLLVAQAQIGQTIKRRAGEFEALPKSAPVRFLRELAHSGYLAEKRNEVQELQEYYDLYLQSTKLIAASYAICGDLKTAEESFKIGEQFMRTIDFSKVKTIGYQHKSASDMFYSAPAEYIEAERMICLDQAKNYDYVALEVSGEKLLEVLDNGQTKEISEANAEQ